MFRHACDMGLEGNGVEAVESRYRPPVRVVAEGEEAGGSVVHE